MQIEPPGQEAIACPYCNAVLEAGVISCRSCGRDLTPVLPLLRRLSKLEGGFLALEKRVEQLKLEAPEPLLLAAPAGRPAQAVATMGSRRLWPLPVGFLILLLCYLLVVIWLDLSLSLLRAASIVVPFVTGFLYLGARYRIHRLDVALSALFSVLCVFSMSAILGWVDSIPILPQGAAAWRETLYYMLSIGASMFSGMLLRMLTMALAVRGLTSLPQLRQGLLSVNKSMPLDTLKAIELTILLLGTLLSAITGLFAGIMGLSG